MFKSCGCQKIDNTNGESDSATINTLDAQGCVLVCFKTKSNKSQYFYIIRKDLRQKCLTLRKNCILSIGNFEICFHPFSRNVFMLHSFV